MAYFMFLCFCVALGFLIGGTTGAAIGAIVCVIFCAAATLGEIIIDL